MNEKEEVFTYEYTAQQQKEVKEIREKYQQKPNELSQMDRLRRLDAGVTKKRNLRFTDCRCAWLLDFGYRNVVCDGMG